MARDSRLDSLFSAPVRAWFEARYDAPTAVQLASWREIARGRDTLVAAPTGSGKTLAAFLEAIDDLVRRSREGPLEDRVHVLYVSPLKALSNDIHRNLEEPLAGIAEKCGDRGPVPGAIRAMVRTGDTPPGEREKMRRRPPQILVTTPESLYLLLTSDSGRAMLGGVETVIVDEIHALVGNKRGCHLALSLARLDGLCARRPRRIGLSATQKPLEEVARFLTGGRDCAIVDAGHQRERDLRLELPSSPLTAILSNETWEEVYDRLAELAGEYRTTLVFVNTRRLAERAARHLAERLGDEAVMAHHGSLSRRHRLAAEQALKDGRVRALVATASLELGIDIGSVDLVCQLGSPGAIAAFLQRVGRSGHQVGAMPRGRLFPLSRDDLVECVALLRAVADGRLDTLRVPKAPLDVLAQQVVAEVAAGERETDALFEQLRSAWPYRALDRSDFDAVVDMLAEGYTSRRGRRGAFLFHDAVNGRLRARPAARLVALQNGGTIPDQFDYEVVLMPQGHRIGTLGEDFAFESVPGDIFQLGNTSYRILKTEQGRVLVEDAAGQPPTIPFWFGERPGRSDELSTAVSELREALEKSFAERGPEPALEALLTEGLEPAAAGQLVEYLYAAWEALGCLPIRGRIVLERFFDDTGDMHLVLHAPLGSRVMRAWGLALRKRFCRRFNFELQASALEDALILSLGETHSFELEEVSRYLKAETVEQVLVQALLDAPMFEARWRWNATIALAVQRMRNGRKVPPQWQRNQAEDLVSVVFPDQIACAENLAGAREVPDHPLVQQTIEDCLRETMDVDGLIRELHCLEAGALDIRCADLTGPSPLSREVISARPYAFLDDGEAENRRTRAISGDPGELGSAATLRIVSVEARHQVRDEAWIRPRSADELHDGLVQLGFLCEPEYTSGDSITGAPGDASRWGAWFAQLVEERRATRSTTPGGFSAWVAAERLQEWLAVHPGAVLHSPVAPLARSGAPPHAEEALVALLRDRLAGLGVVSVERLAAGGGLDPDTVRGALLQLQGRGYAIRLEQDEAPDVASERWCERRLLARVHRYSRERRRRSVKPVPPTVFARFLLRWHQLDEPGTLAQALARLEGWAAPVDAWRRFLLESRCGALETGALDQPFLSGQWAWFRPRVAGAGQQVVSASPVAVVRREDLDAWRGVREEPVPGADGSRRDPSAQAVFEALERGGATFMADLERATGLPPERVEPGLRQLVYEGAVTADAFSPLDWLLRPERIRARARARLAQGRGGAGLPLGRWSALPPPGAAEDESAQPLQEQQALAAVCKALLRRYGVVFRAVLERETLVPPWRTLLAYLRRMEDRGEVRGGRFVDGFSGEQFALPEALGLMRQCAGPAADGAMVVISAADPLNLGGIVLPGPKTAAVAAHRVLLEDGLPVARVAGETFEELPGISPRARRMAGDALRVVTPWRRVR